MSEQPNNVVQFPGSREGSRFEGSDVQLDLHKNVSVPKYNAEAIAAMHEATRLAREAAAQRSLELQANEPTIEDITVCLNNLVKTRRKLLEAA